MTESEYNVQEGADVGRKDVNMFCNKNQFPLFLFGGPHTKLHVVRWLSKHEHIRFDPKIGHVICAICLIPCACDECTPTKKNLGFMVSHHRKTALPTCHIFHLLANDSIL